MTRWAPVQWQNLRLKIPGDEYIQMNSDEYTMREARETTRP
jgi:hypothetical protein